MQKIISLFVFVALIAWTWSVTHSSDSVSFETHSGIQKKLAELIKANLVAKKPNSKNVQIVHLWTESIGENKVRAVFAYKFADGEAENAAEQTIEGEAILHREPSDDAENDKWILQNVKTTNDTVNFTEGVLITPHDGEEADGAKDSAATKTGPEATAPAATATPAATTH